jgi:hypothetical protein
MTCDPGVLMAGTQYYWRVVATDNHGASTSGAVWRFRTTLGSNHPPSRPSAPSPNDGAVDVPAATTLSWVGGDPDAGDTVTYDVYLEAADSSPDPLVCEDMVTTTCDPGTLVPGRQYYWVVVATDNRGVSTASPIWRFRTAITANLVPDEPSDPSPGDGAGDVPVSTTLSWLGGDPDAGDSVTYDVYLDANDSTPRTLVCSDLGTAMCHSGILAGSTRHYWQVVATDNHGASTAGPVWSFVTRRTVYLPLVLSGHSSAP